MAVAKVVEGVGEFRPQPHGRHIGGGGPGIISLRLQRVPEVEVCLGGAGIGLQDTPVRGGRLLPSLQCRQHLGQAELIARLIRERGGGLSDRRQCRFRPPRLQFQQADLEQRRRVIRRDRQHLLVEAARLVQIAGAMLLRCQLQQLIRGHWLQRPRLAVLAFEPLVGIRGVGELQVRTVPLQLPALLADGDIAEQDEFGQQAGVIEIAQRRRDRP